MISPHHLSPVTVLTFTVPSRPPAMVATVPLHHPHFLPTKPYLSHHRSANSPILRPSPSTVWAFSRSDFEGFARRVSSGEALRDALRSANEGIEKLTFEVRLAAERLDRRYAVSNRIGTAARAAVDRAREIDFELGIGRRWRSFSMDFSRNLPRYRKELSGFLGTPIGRGSMIKDLPQIKGLLAQGDNCRGDIDDVN